MRIGALGGPSTFAGQAAERFRDLGQLTYFERGPDEWTALATGAIDAFVMLAESSVSGPGELARRAAGPDFRYFVLAEVQVPYGCLLLARPDSGPIAKILGHGSIRQCMAYLEAHYPSVPVEVEETSSLEAAQKVFGGDGSLALVGTAATAKQFGLEILAQDIDAGATGNYWLVGDRADFAEQPRTLIVSGRFAGQPDLTVAIGRIASAGFTLRTIAGWPTGRALFEYDYLLSFTGHGRLDEIRHVPGVRLVGAF